MVLSLLHGHPAVPARNSPRRHAPGRADAFYESRIYLWDAAAAGLIVEQAGGCAEIMASKPPYQLRIIASNGRLHTPLRRLIL